MENINNTTNNDDGYYTPYNIDIVGLDRVKLENYIDRILKLPNTIGRNLTSFDSALFIEDGLGTRFHITAIQKKDVTRIIRDILLCDLYLGDIVQNISDRLVVAPDVAKEISNSIITELFKDSLEDIKKLQIQKFGNKTPPPVNNAPATRSPEPKYPGVDLPETGGNIINLRNQK